MILSFIAISYQVLPSKNGFLVKLLKYLSILKLPKALVTFVGRVVTFLGLNVTITAP